MRPLSCGLLLIIALPMAHFVNAAESLVGRRVFVKEGAPTTVAEEGKEKSVLNPYLLYGIVEEDAERVRIRNAWLKKSEVMAPREAKEYYQKQVESVPTIANAWHGLGVALIETRDFAGSLKALDEAIRLDGESATLLTHRGIAKGHVGDLVGASRDFEQSLSIDPKSWQAHFAIARMKFVQQDIRGVLSSLDSAIAIEKGEAMLFQSRGAAKERLGDLTSALADLNEAVRLDPVLEEAYRGRGSVKMRLKWFDDALADINQAISLEPANVMAWGMRGVVKRHLNDNKGSLQAFDYALTQNPRDAYALRGRGMLKMDMGDGKGALKDYDALFAICTPDAQCYFERSYVHNLNKNFDLALEDIRAAVKLSPENVEYRKNQGILAVEVEQHEEAIKDLDWVLERNPKTDLAHLYRGMAKLKLFDLEGAIQDLDKAAKLNGRDARPAYHRGLAKLEQGDRKAALVDLEKALALSGGNSEINTRRDRVKAAEERLDNQGFHVSLDVSTEDRSEVKALVTKALTQLYFEQFAWAQENFEKAIEQESTNLIALSGKSAAQFAKKEYAAVVESQNEILKHYPKDLTQLQNRAIAKMLAKDFEGAVADFNDVIVKRTKSAPAHCKRGYAKLFLKDYTGAVADFDEAMRLDADHLEAVYLKALLLATCEDASMRDIAKARSLFEQAKAKSPDNSYSQTASACLLAIEGKYEEAIALQEKAMQDKKFMEDPRILGGGYAQERIAAWKEKKLWTLH